MVDDDADVAMYLETRLTNFGFTVRVFPDPAGLEQGIAETSPDDFDARLEAVRKGCDGYVIKPVNVVELAETLDRLIARDTVNPYRALLVDDDPETVGYHALLLKAAGVLTLTATDPEEAVARLADFRTDALRRAAWTTGTADFQGFRTSSRTPCDAPHRRDARLRPTTHA